MENTTPHISTLALGNGLEISYDRSATDSSRGGGNRSRTALLFQPDGLSLASLTTHSGNKLIISKVFQADPSRKFPFSTRGGGSAPRGQAAAPCLLQPERAAPGPVDCDLVHSLRGNTFEGVSFQDRLVIFAYEPWHPFAGTTYVASGEAVFHHLAGFPANASFSVSLQELSRGFVQVSITPGGAFATGPDGVLAFVVSSYGPINLLRQSSDAFLDAFFGGATPDKGETPASFAFLRTGRIA